MQEMVIYGVSFDMVGKQPIVLLKTIDGNKFLPIWIGHPEAAAILMKLQGATDATAHDSRPDQRSDLRAGRDLHQGRRHRAEGEHLFRLHHAQSQRPGGRHRLAAIRRSRRRRPLSAPIFAAEEVIQESAIEFEHEVEDTEEVVDNFKKFLDEVTPEDFASGSG